MSYTLDLAPELEAQLRTMAEAQHKDETDILLAAIQDYLWKRSRAIAADPDGEAWLDAIEQEGWLDEAW
jgi:predicted transcriptional regulator